MTFHCIVALDIDTGCHNSIDYQMTHTVIVRLKVIGFLLR